MLKYKILALVYHTKNYKYNKYKQTHYKIKDVWGAIIERGVLIVGLVLALVVIPIMAQDGFSGKGTDILGNGILESSDGFKFPVVADTNFDSITVGNDNAKAYGFEGFFPFTGPKAKAENNLEIKKNQQVGQCECCGILDNCSPCQDCCTTVNIEQVHVGDRNANAFGLASAVNTVKLIFNQAT